MSERLVSAAREVRWCVRERAIAAAEAWDARRALREAGAGVSVRERNAVVRRRVLWRAEGTVSCGTARARARSARSLRAWALRARGALVGGGCIGRRSVGARALLRDRIERAQALAVALEQFSA